MVDLIFGVVVNRTEIKQGGRRGRSAADETMFGGIEEGNGGGGVGEVIKDDNYVIRKHNHKI